MALFGWCMEGRHDACRVRFQKWYFGNKRVKRKTVETIIYLDEYEDCTCKCHGKKVKKTRTRKRKS